MYRDQFGNAWQPTICPILSVIGDDFTPCAKDRCALWQRDDNPGDDQCSISSIATGINALRMDVSYLFDRVDDAKAAAAMDALERDHQAEPTT